MVDSLAFHPTKTQNGDHQNQWKLDQFLELLIHANICVAVFGEDK